jgi:hypothetical protein
LIIKNVNVIRIVSVINCSMIIDIVI